MIYCFFKDFNYMREYVQERWCNYQDGKLSLSAVALVTNTEGKLLEQIPVRSGSRDYNEMAMMLFTEVGLEHVDYGMDLIFVTISCCMRSWRTFRMQTRHSGILRAMRKKV